MTAVRDNPLEPAVGVYPNCTGFARNYGEGGHGAAVRGKRSEVGGQKGRGGHGWHGFYGWMDGGFEQKVMKDAVGGQR